MSRSPIAVLIALALMATTGCYKTTVKYGRGGGTTIEENKPYLLYGIVPLGDEVVNAGKKCPAGLQEVQVEQTFVDGLLSFITLGIYSPLTVRYTCR